MAKGTLQQRIHSAWELRFNQRIEACLLASVALKSELGIPAGAITPEALPSLLVPRGKETVAQRAESLLLHASLSRAQGLASQSRALIEALEARLLETGLPDHFFALFERGITWFAQGESLPALEYFMRASQNAPTDFFKYAALVNTLLCLENLGMPFGDTLAAIRALEPLRSDQADGLKSQIDAFDKREAFRKAEFSRIFAADSAKAGQSQYYTLWARSLPYHTGYEGSADTGLSEMLKGASLQYQRAYRIRTLQGINHGDDWTTLKPSEFVDRLYLWVWRWLQEPGFPVSKAIAVISKSGIFTKIATLDFESRLLLKNALSWLSLFDAASGARVSGIQEALQTGREHLYPIFALESDLIYALKTLRDEGLESSSYKDAVSNLENHPLWKNPEVYFRSLLESAVTAESGTPSSVPGLSKLSLSLRQLLESASLRREAPIVVDLSQFKITCTASGEQTVSEPMAKALDLLHEKGSVPVELLVEICFGIRNYDSIIHQGKVFNLISRMKRLGAAQLRFRTKSGVVLAEGAWSEFAFKKPPARTSELRKDQNWKQILAAGDMHAASVERPSSVIPSVIKWQGQISRPEIEKLVQRPRSTVNRWLQEWERQGLVRRQGAARATRYSLRNGISQLELPQETKGAFV